MRQSTNQNAIVQCGKSFSYSEGNSLVSVLCRWIGHRLPRLLSSKLSDYLFVSFQVKPQVFYFGGLATTNLSEGEKDMRSSHASPSRPRLLQLLLFPLLLEREGR